MRPLTGPLPLTDKGAFDEKVDFGRFCDGTFV